MRELHHIHVVQVSERHVEKSYKVNINDYIDDYTHENKSEHSPKRPYIKDHPYKILLIGGPG